ncbi:hypothetical protein A2501_00290 [Candidatus Uhrbacteria bacterium RIFOXYC12_FULL_57_11]|nr:MAG: hypothetical protein A2501_00290 [Candidatus Uhrbacteria bacterium RIFOXYC12_FULL_57_11]
MTPPREAWLLTDLFMGDQGKGTTVDYLARLRGAHTVVRFNGGAQAAHHVVGPDGQMHRFQQFGSATLVPGVATHLTRFMVLSPWNMLEEEERLARLGVTDAFKRTTISENALVITPWHEIANRMRERARGVGRHGSCGAGVGETVKDSLELDPSLIVRVRDLVGDAIALREKFLRVQAYKLEQLRAEGVLAKCTHLRDAVHDIDDLFYPSVVDEYLCLLAPFLERARIVPDAYLGEILARPGTVIFEPAQGVLIDEWRGFHPYTTWSTCTLDNADALLEEHGYAGEVHRLGIVRAYGTRHGAGPFVTEDAGLSVRVPDAHNGQDGWQGVFRVGWFDAVAVRYAIACIGKLDGLIVTCLDRLKDEAEWKICTAYDTGRDIQLGPFKDLEYQEALTRRLFEAVPRYGVSTRASTQEERVAEHVAAIERELGLHVWITSHGPTANDKRLTAHFGL